MDTKALEKFCPWARVELIDAVHLRCVRYALDDAGRAAHPADADVVAGTVLTPSEKTQRAALFERIERLNEERGGKGYAAFCEQQAYSWFNRFAAIRFMGLHGYLSNNVRMLSAGSGAFEPECLRMASELDLPGLELAEVLDLITAGDDEALFRRILVAQMNELADCLPTMFGHVDAADALTLPDNLLARGEHDVLFHLVADIPEEAWDDVEVLGWMYQFYNSELKDDFFKSKRKAAVEDLAPATQLFTPDWIVRYMVENSLGRLWMLNNPGSRLREGMAYYIEPDAEHEDFIHIEGPEDITFCDPACGSGHILVYAFELLFRMYVERGYRERDVPRIILEKNLSGMEIDERAAQIASLALALCAREHDRRFFTRGVTADICVLGGVDIDVDALDPASELRRRPELIEALAHLGEVGSLLTPSPEDLGTLKGELMRDLSGDLFVSHTLAGIERAAELCEALSRTFDVVVANPPYMGSSSFNPFMSKWMKKNYPDSCKDLCTAFIERGYSLSKIHGYASMVTMSSWMFLSSFEKMRNDIVDNRGILSLLYMGHMVMRIAFNTSAIVFYNGKFSGKGTYNKIESRHLNADSIPEMFPAEDEPFHRADASTFHDIPGSPIAYWASEAAVHAFKTMKPLGSWLTTREGMATADNDRFVRSWWESPLQAIGFEIPDQEAARLSGKKWFPYQKGGEYRKWYGNNDLIVNWENDGSEIRSNIDVKTGRIRSHNYNGEYGFIEGITWSSLSSGRIHLRFSPRGSLFDSKGAKGFAQTTEQCLYAIALINSSPAALFLTFLAPTLDYKVGDVIVIPDAQANLDSVCVLAKGCIGISRADWDTQETSWDFKRNPLI
ncbi:MAG: BREX-1 system adenine-specific DNA-methyltransferase PglX [Collinsella stercoris]|nr:BREX-1 system adenine-specific DNA-methyltransferase PglX [Collinsella stercoris]